MRIARILTRLNLGGPARQVLASDPLLRARGHELRVFVGQPEDGEGDLAGDLADRGVEVVRVPGLGRAIRPLRDMRVARDLRLLLEDFGPDIVHTHASKAGFVGRRAVFRRPEMDVRTVHTFHGHVLEGYFPPATSWLLARLEEQLARRTDRILAVSEATAADLARLRVVARERVRLSPPGLDLAPFLALDPERRSDDALRFRAELGLGPEERLVLVLGRLAPIKRPEVALDVFARAALEDSAAHLVFVGGGVIQPLIEKRRNRLEPAVAQRVHFAGARPESVSAISAADVVLLSSKNEGLPVALIEASAGGRPVVASAVGGVAEVVRNGLSGFLAAEEDGLAEALSSLLQDADLRRAMGQNGRAHVAERHSAEALADRLEGVYSGLSRHSE